MVDSREIRDGMRVVGSDGKAVGRVEGTTSEGFMLRPDGTAGAAPHRLPLDWVTRVDDEVHLRHSAAALHGEMRQDVPAGPLPEQKVTTFPRIAAILVVLVALVLLAYGVVGG